MARIHIRGRDGLERDLDAEPGASLMDALRDAGTGVEGTCGGAMSCGTCHVYVEPDWLVRLASKSQDEADMLEAIAEIVPLRPTSRLSCQIPVTDELHGLHLEIGPPT